MKYVGVDIGGTNLKAGLADENGQLLAVQKMKVASVTDQQSLAWTIVAMTQELAKSAGVPLDDIASVGVGVPGTVEIRSGSIGYTCNLPLRNVPLRKLFHHYLSIPLYIENDANCAALAEYYVGAGRDSKRFVTITLGTGVGAGIIHNGKVYHGANGMAGEVGQQGAAAAGMAGALLNIFSFVALIAINLAVMNLLPLPALDGGKIFFLVINAVSMQLFKKQIPAKYENYIHFAGLILLLALMAVITFSDVWKLIH